MSLAAARRLSLQYASLLRDEESDVVTPLTSIWENAGMHYFIEKTRLSANTSDCPANVATPTSDQRTLCGTRTRAIQMSRLGHSAC
jgi:hypothetical protein